MNGLPAMAPSRLLVTRWQVMRDPEGNEFCVVREGSDGLVKGP